MLPQAALAWVLDRIETTFGTTLVDSTSIPAFRSILDEFPAHATGFRTRGPLGFRTLDSEDVA
jgi:hypothetical protein